MNHTQSSSDAGRSTPWRYKTGIFAGLWLAGIFAGVFILLQFSQTPGEQAEAPLRLPAKSRFSLEHKTKALNNKPMLLVFLHPKCSCSRASLTELGRLMPRLIDKAAVYVSFTEFKGSADDWLVGDLWKMANEIPGVDVIVDRDGREAGLYDVRTSGQVLLYSESGELAFKGGLTAARGHEGDSAGRGEILAWFEDRRHPLAAVNTFGCEIQSPAARLPANQQQGRAAHE